MIASAVSDMLPSKSGRTNRPYIFFCSYSISEFLADFEAFVYRIGDLLFDLFRRAVVHIPS